MQYKPGAIDKLATKLQGGGYTVTLEPWNPFDIWYSSFHTAILWLQVRIKNSCKQHWIAKLYTTTRRVLVVSALGGPGRTPALVSNTSSSGDSRASSSRAPAQTQGTTNQSTYSSGTSVPLQSVPVASSQVVAGSSTNPSNVTIPSSSDFIHVCFKVGTYMKLRHDLRLDVITRDRELFQSLRKAYAERFSWTHRMFSLQTVQKIKFVQVRSSCNSDTIANNVRSSSSGDAMKSTI